MSQTPPTFAGRSTFLHGFARRDDETAPGIQPSTWWGSTDLVLPEGTNETIVRLQAADGAHSRGILYRRGPETTVVVFNHPRADFSCHYLIPSLVAAGYAAFGGQGRNLGNDIDCVHEYLLADLAAQIGYLRRQGFEKVLLCGNSGGGSLSTFYQAQATTKPPGRLTATPAGDPYDLNTIDLPPADGLILLAAHIGEGAFALDNLDPSVIDENDPLSCDPTLDMYNPANGYRRPPEVSSYSPEFVERYRAAQRARVTRLDAVARQDIARRRRYRELMARWDFRDRPLDEQLHITRLATTSRYLTIARVAANPSYTDLSIDRSHRTISTLLGPDPHTANYKLGGFASVMTPEGWLSTWSGQATRASVLANITNVTEPTLVISFDADAGILPHEARSIFDRAGAEDRELGHVDANHYGLARTEPREAPIVEAGNLIVRWLKARFPAAGAPETADSPNVAVVKEYFRRGDARSADVLDLFTEDVEFFFPKHGVGHGKAEFIAFAAGLRDSVYVLHDQETMTFLENGSRVVVEGTTYGHDSEGSKWQGAVTPGGRFCSVFEIRDGLIARNYIYADPDYTSRHAEGFRWGLDRQW
ncbi:nuclear transport factor 2 family protein [Frankia sp. AgB1.9]|uniref:nuclear transport factor 2 family protein n=1 Tax=unclassified Frankia TaxID=2632575 RepID=UPI001933A794|nr:MULTISPECIES: nuclear transport factor 2 family protein [unclassified Frankia]MBL7493337.1 nuclear transport factor 2 family protein [Frankia sp. AgW1.1]MBL7549569.1 nuclear transport factor 2 family protein [Frankia sp. AgB1.9]MBL7620451.1 nuclear transport factor 2 family protein [Frankia sp. AgB1.8]